MWVFRLSLSVQCPPEIDFVFTHPIFSQMPAWPAQHRLTCPLPQSLECLPLYLALVVVGDDARMLYVIWGKQEGLSQALAVRIAAARMRLLS